jgi:hypothetical protein
VVRFFAAAIMMLGATGQLLSALLLANYESLFLRSLFASHDLGKEVTWKKARPSRA